jgi:hypothetical protein
MCRKMTISMTPVIFIHQSFLQYISFHSLWAIQRETERNSGLGSSWSSFCGTLSLIPQLIYDEIARMFHLTDASLISSNDLASFDHKVLDFCDKVWEWLPTGQWFSPGTPVSSTNKNCPLRNNWNIVESGVETVWLTYVIQNKHVTT